jgi:hypothetical protein
LRELSFRHGRVSLHFLRGMISVVARNRFETHLLLLLLEPLGLQIRRTGVSPRFGRWDFGRRSPALLPIMSRGPCPKTQDYISLTLRLMIAENVLIQGDTWDFAR